MNLSDAILCTIVLDYPILLISDNPELSVERLCQLLKTWPIESQISCNRTDNGVSIFPLGDIDIQEQRSLYKEIRKQKYPLILVSSSNFQMDKKLKSLILFEYVDSDDIKLLPTPSDLIFDGLNAIKQKVQDITITTQLQTYIYDLVVELRYSRFIKNGLATYLITDLTNFIKFRTYTLGMTFVTPLIVKQSFKITLPLHLHLISAEDDPTLMYGSNLKLIKQLVNVINVDDVIEIAISNVIPPL